MLEAKGVSRTFIIDDCPIEALPPTNLILPDSQSMVILGPSGCGKSTLLSILGLLDQPTQGEVWFQNQRIDQLNDQERTQMRRNDFGFVFQRFHLLPVLSALENAMMPALLTGQSEEMASKRATELLYSVGLQKKINLQVKNLSGGERQRVAVARALVHAPKIVLADEPTANLDQASNELVSNLIFDLTRANKASLLFVTHDERLAIKADMVRRMGRKNYEYKISAENSL